VGTGIGAVSSDVEPPRERRIEGETFPLPSPRRAPPPWSHLRASGLLGIAPTGLGQKAHRVREIFERKSLYVSHFEANLEFEVGTGLCDFRDSAFSAFGEVLAW
jgi:hypothetical protein